MIKKAKQQPAVATGLRARPRAEADCGAPLQQERLAMSPTIVARPFYCIRDATVRRLQCSSGINCCC